jgi:hypothetical protein
MDAEGKGSCDVIPQNGGHGKAAGPEEFASHLGRTFSELGDVRDAAIFACPRVRMVTWTPATTRTIGPYGSISSLGSAGASPSRPISGSAVDPNNEVFLIDNSWHGTGTLAILAGGGVSAGPSMTLVERQRPKYCIDRCPTVKINSLRLKPLLNAMVAFRIVVHHPRVTSQRLFAVTNAGALLIVASRK